MIGPGTGVRVYLACGVTDMRKGIALYHAESICISDYTDSVEHDVQLMRGSVGTPKHANIYGYMYDIDEEKLIKVTQSLAA
ncbi:hypothetical protein K3555_16765 [Leisingera sp. M527]|uniref:hypothetical protein n=1 Tax=Leisingera sp. M527 TaxID=2867014 RepID=UPI0021A59E1D|nr:hypothetical protein [Leisingera sp. M527]UWQ32192.1 hypothetical protein K3555_16765 [Leisingera sp. M527]